MSNKLKKLLLLSLTVVSLQTVNAMGSSTLFDSDDEDDKPFGSSPISSSHASSPRPSSSLYSSHSTGDYSSKDSYHNPFKSKDLNKFYQRFHSDFTDLHNNVDFGSWKNLFNDFRKKEEANAVSIVTWLNDLREESYKEDNQGKVTHLFGDVNKVILKIFGGCWGIREATEHDNIDELRDILNSTLSSAVETNTVMHQNS